MYTGQWATRYLKTIDVFHDRRYSLQCPRASDHSPGFRDRAHGGLIFTVDNIFGLLTNHVSDERFIH